MCPPSTVRRSTWSTFTRSSLKVQGMYTDVQGMYTKC